MRKRGPEGNVMYMYFLFYFDGLILLFTFTEYIKWSFIAIDLK